MEIVDILNLKMWLKDEGFVDKVRVWWSSYQDKKLNALKMI